MPKVLRNIIGRTLWYFRNKKRIVEVLKENDFDYVIFGGGQMIQSNGTFPFMIDYWTKSVKKHSKAKILYFGIGIGSNILKNDKKKIVNSLNRAEKIFVRDFYSKQRGEELLNNQREIYYTPDVVFSLNNFIEESISKEKSVLIGIPIRTHLQKFGEYSEIEKVYDWYIEKIKEYKDKGYKVKYTYTTRRDYQETLIFDKYLKSKTKFEVEFLSYNTLEEMIVEISKAEIIISGRMHSLIIGYVYKCELIPFIFSQKIKSFYLEYIENKPNIERLQREIRDSLNNALSEKK